MRTLINWAAVAALVLTLPVGCGNDDGGKVETHAAPQIAMVGSDIDATHEITEQMSVKVQVKAPAGIKTFEIEIDSPALTDQMLGAVGLAKRMELVSPASEAMAGALKGFGFPVKADVLSKTDLTFDISPLIPMIKLIYLKTSNHNFKLTVTDALSQTTVKTLMFHSTGTTVALYNGDADLWANTATLSLSVDAAADADVKVDYRIKNESVWSEGVVGTIDSDGSYPATLAPVWEQATNAAGKTIYTTKAKTGIFAQKAYEYRVKVNGEVKTTGEFTPKSNGGDLIPNADMAGWSTIQQSNIANQPTDVAYPNAEGNAFWGCGNNGITTTLCSMTTEKFGAASPSAKLASVNMFVLAAGNLFTGDFSYASFTGTVLFGQKYTYSARPTALRLKYHATVGATDVVRENSEDYDFVEGVAKNDPDKARIFVAIVDWTTQHQVSSSIQRTTGAWDPEKGSDVATEGKIIGYGSIWIAQSTSGDAMQDATLAINWYDKSAKPTAGNYSVVISCACNAYGDYMTGCSTNVMHVDDFAWVY